MALTQPNRLDEMHERQKLRNDKSKYWASIIGQNMSLAVCMMIPVFLIMLIWTDTTLPKLGASLATDTFLTAALFIFAEASAISVGTPSGKLDDEHLAIQEAFRIRKSEIKARGILKMGVFCDWQIDDELTGAKKAYCRKYKIEWHYYKNVLCKLTDDELVSKFGKVKGRMISKINGLEPIELTPELILGEQRNGMRGGISISGDEYAAQQKYGIKKILTSVLAIVLTVGVGFAFSPGITWGKIVFTIYRLIAVIMRMGAGFSRGAKAYNTIEVKHRESQIYYMDKYEEFLDTPGLYEAAAERYGDSLVPVKEATTNEVKTDRIEPGRDRADPGERATDAGAEPTALAIGVG